MPLTAPTDFEGLTGLSGLFPDDATVTPVTDGLTLTSEWGPSYAEDIFTLNNKNIYSAKTQVALTPTTVGVIFEAGAGGAGTILYCHDGRVYWQGGSGTSNRKNGVDFMELSWLIPEAGTFLIEVSASGQIDNQKAALYVNGIRVDGPVSMSENGNLSGGNAGGIGQQHSSIAGNRMTIDPPYTFTGPAGFTVSIYEGQLVSDLS